MRNQYEVTLKPSRRKKKIFKHMIITSDDVSGTSSVFSYNPKVLFIFIILLCVVIGGLIGVIYYEKQQDKLYKNTISEKDSEISYLNKEKDDLNFEIDSLNDTVQILSDTVNIKTENEKELTQTLEAQSIPSYFPLTGSATICDNDSDIPTAVFKVTDGATVVSAATGTITDVYEDEQYGNVIVIDHGTGYITYYMNSGTVMVNADDDVVQGTTLFIIDSDNEMFYYRITYKGEFIDPLDMLDISG